MRGLVVPLALAVATPALAQPPVFWPAEVEPGPCGRPPTAGSRSTSRYATEAGDRVNVVLRWNDLALRAIRADKTPPPLAARHLAVMHLAMYDAVSPGRRTHEPFHVRTAGPADASSESAVAAAAWRVLKTIYPQYADTFDDALNELPDLEGLDEGVRWGRKVADWVIAWRASDLTPAPSVYTPRPGPGRWAPTPPGYKSPLLPSWGKAPLFALKSAEAVRPPEPPALTSPEFAAAFRQVQALGSRDSRMRTAEQTEIAKFWADGEGTVTPPGHWNRIAAAVARDRGLSRAETARLFAMLNVALADAAIACWECKFRFDVWRPVTAIRNADQLKNPDLVAEPDWTPLLTTPPFPAYTSGHSSFSGAAAAVLAQFFGTDRVRFTTASDGLPGVTRSFASFTDAATEAGLSRIYGGIHWSFDNTAGQMSGRKIGEYVARNFFGPLAR
ncbi:MAG TPA: phosphatase PAP2 family protein [Gemmataceae bacterium]|nr:phosphatase PAP2 family protein [Gemmataceae bacterium]